MLEFKKEEIIKYKISNVSMFKFNKEYYVVPLNEFRFPPNIANYKELRADIFTGTLPVILTSKNIIHLLYMNQEYLEQGKIHVISLQLTDKALEKVKRRILKFKQTKVHCQYLYALALMWWYVGWAETKEYDICLNYIKRLRLDKKFRKIHKFPIYRALSISPKGKDKLLRGKKILLKKRVGTSWSIGKKRPLWVARQFKQQQFSQQQEEAIKEYGISKKEAKLLPQPKVICLRISRPSSDVKVILNAYILKYCDEFKLLSRVLTKNYLSMHRNILDEILLEKNGGFSWISEKNLV